MKRSRTTKIVTANHIFKAVLSALFMVITSQGCVAQNDDANEMVPIEYNFKTNTFNKTFPFDEMFSIKLIAIPKDADSVMVRFVEYDLKKFKPAPGAKIITAQDIQATGITYQTKGWNRGTAKDSVGEIPVIYPLRPNRKYVVEIEQYKKRDLTDAEKTALTNALKQDLEIKGIIRSEIKKCLEDTSAIPHLASLSVIQASLNDVAKRVVLNVNKSYRVNPINLSLQLHKLTDFIISLTVAKASLQNIGSIAKNEPNHKEIDSLTTLYINKINLIDWSAIRSGDEGLNTLNSLKTQIFALFAHPEANNLPIYKRKLDAFNDGFATLLNEWLTTVPASIIAHNTYVLSTVGATYRADFVKNAKLYVTLDLGAAYVGNIDRVLSYSGVNIYLRPVNKNIPLRNYTGFKDWMGVRTSILLGITMSSIDKANTRKGLIGNSALVLGAGIRPVPFMKINAGCFVYYKYANNPLITQERYNTAFSPFVSLSIDLDVKPLFSGIGEAIFK